MIRKTVALGLVSLLVSTSLYAGKKPNFTIQELINLPHPLQAIMQNEESMGTIGLDEHQKKQINNKMLVVYPPYIMDKMAKAQKLEDEIKQDVMQKDMTADELTNKIDNLVKLKREVADKHIESLNVLATILTPKQYKQGMEMFKKFKLQKMQKKIKKQLEDL